MVKFSRLLRFRPGMMKWASGWGFSFLSDVMTTMQLSWGKMNRQKHRINFIPFIIVTESNYINFEWLDDKYQQIKSFESIHVKLCLFNSFLCQNQCLNPCKARLNIVVLNRSTNKYQTKWIKFTIITIFWLCNYLIIFFVRKLTNPLLFWTQVNITWVYLQCVTNLGSKHCFLWAVLMNK